MLQSMGSQRVGYDRVTEQQKTGLAPGMACLMRGFVCLGTSAAGQPLSVICDEVSGTG